MRVHNGPAPNATCQIGILSPRAIIATQGYRVLCLLDKEQVRPLLGNGHVHSHSPRVQLSMTS
ncbi:hypothetical protein SCLCIDRAFT_1216115 [Scleroderma citrinum Foug A]|uniref:Uncharacterized protein n=1 Tax=Scleroderma citrinum Foug A TaxID=1036808 RepID=A0A0C3DZC9_9AGAM|nr:hypothetical protein SCLCIDRAFT_1216115 [Scleroderma citrinum Foug A]